MKRLPIFRTVPRFLLGGAVLVAFLTWVIVLMAPGAVSQMEPFADREDSTPAPAAPAAGAGDAAVGSLVSLTPLLVGLLIATIAVSLVVVVLRRRRS